MGRSSLSSMSAVGEIVPCSRPVQKKQVKHLMALVQCVVLGCFSWHQWQAELGVWQIVWLPKSGNPQTEFSTELQLSRGIIVHETALALCDSSTICHAPSAQKKFGKLIPSQTFEAKQVKDAFPSAKGPQYILGTHALGLAGVPIFFQKLTNSIFMYVHSRKAKIFQSRDIAWTTWSNIQQVPLDSTTFIHSCVYT